jgi:hypothetical protein
VTASPSLQSLQSEDSTLVHSERLASNPTPKSSARATPRRMSAANSLKVLTAASARLSIDASDSLQIADSLKTMLHRPANARERTSVKANSEVVVYSQAASPLVTTSQPQMTQYPSSLSFRSANLVSALKVANIPVTSASIANKLDPNIPICPYELGGTCNDKSCKFQHASSYLMTNEELLLVSALAFVSS